MPALRPTLRTALLLSLTAAYLLPIVWILHRVGDEGTLLYGAQRVSEGAIPGRDFVEVLGPGSFYWLGLFFKLFGAGWLVTRIVLLFTGVATSGLLYAIARQVCSESLAALHWLFALTLGIPLWPAVNHHWDSNFFAIAALWCYLKLDTTGRRSWALAAGGLAGITSCFMQQKGLLLLLAFLVSGCLRAPGTALFSGVRPAKGRTAKRRTLWLLPAAYAGVGIAVAAAYWKAGALGDLYYANVTWPLSGYHAINATYYGQLLASIAILPAVQVVGPNSLRLICSVFSLFPFLVIATLPLLCVGAALACLIQPDTRRRWLSGPLAAIAPAGAALWLSEIHRPDVFHLIYGSPVLLIILIASVAMRFSSPRRNVLFGCLAACLLLFGALNLVAHRQGVHEVVTRRGAIPSVSDDEALKFLCTSVDRREFVFVYPYYPVYYYLADVRNPTRFSILLYGYNTPEQFDEVIGNLEDKRVRYILWDTDVYGNNLRVWFPAYRHPDDNKLKLERYFQTNYDVIGVKGGFRILRRRTSNESGMRP